MSTLRTTFARFFDNKPARCSTRKPPRRRFEQLESRIVFSGGLDQLGPLPDLAIADAADAEGACPVAESETQYGVTIAFPDVCKFMPPPVEHPSVIVIHHPDGTIEWIDDLPSATANDQGGGGVYNNGGTIDLSAAQVTDEEIIKALNDRTQVVALSPSATQEGSGLWNDTTGTNEAPFIDSFFDFWTEVAATNGSGGGILNDGGTLFASPAQQLTDGALDHTEDSGGGSHGDVDRLEEGNEGSPTRPVSRSSNGVLFNSERSTIDHSLNATLWPHAADGFFASESAHVGDVLSQDLHGSMAILIGWRSSSMATGRRVYEP